MAQAQCHPNRTTASVLTPQERPCRATVSSVAFLGNSSKALKAPSLRAATTAQRPRQAALAVRGDANAVAEQAAPSVVESQPLDSQPVAASHLGLPLVEISLPAALPESKIIEAEFLDFGLIGSSAATLEAAPEHPAGDLQQYPVDKPANAAEETEPLSTHGAAAVPREAALAPQVETSASSTPEAAESESNSEDTTSEEDYYEPVLELLAAAKVVPHPAKVEKGGEDAYLISDVGAGVLCVADGVGGWANDGVDPALYSKELVYHMQVAVENAQCQEDLVPRELIRVAHSATRAEGAATAVVAVFDGERSSLDVANLGDSGVLIVRNGEVVFKTEHQQHYFDCPFQLGSESSDSPDDAQLYAVELMEGDTVVMGSDGLFDNVFDKDVACVVKVFGGHDSIAVQRMATALAALASKHAADPEYMSPYILEAVESGQDLPVWEKMLGRKLSGGKLDDITVVVAQVVKSQSQEESASA